MIPPEGAGWLSVAVTVAARSAESASSSISPPLDSARVTQGFVAEQASLSSFVPDTVDAPRAL